ncbi:MAG: shikimate kinase [Thermoplasmata archaeon]|jgi:shikimate kinase|nr:shikimate kinase [Thermoplasmata archaeon]
MRGVGRSTSAVTIVNALTTGVGCAIGIQRFVTASVDLEVAASPSLDCTPPGSDSALVRAAVDAALGRFGRGQRFHASLDLRSDVPVAKGLKSSSAVASAITIAVARALKASPTPLEVARRTAEVTRGVGLSATGALDDALAGLRSGFVLTDNRNSTLIAEQRAPSSWTTVVYLPPGVHAPSPDWKSRFEAVADQGRPIVDAARAHRYPEAMERNSVLVESVMGYDYTELRTRMRAAGAVAVGVSGLGPALAALVPRDRVAAVAASLPTDVGEHFTAELTTDGAE